MKTKITLTIFACLGLLLISNAENLVKIQTTSSGGFYAFGSFPGQLTFPNGEIIGNKFSDSEGYFLAKFDSLGNTQWVKHLKSYTINCIGHCSGIGLCTDQADNIYITASFDDTLRFDSTHAIIPSSSLNAFVAKYDSNGVFIWAKGAQGTALSEGVDIETDSMGNVYTTGVFGAGDFAFDSLPLLPDRSYAWNIYMAKFDSAGTCLWQRPLHGGGTGDGSNHQVYSITADNKGNSYILGYFGGFFSGGLRFGNFSLPSTRRIFEIFVAKCDPWGHPLWLTKVNGMDASDFPEQITVGDSNNLYFTGFLTHTAQFGTLPNVSTNHQDVFIARYDSLGNAQWVRQGSPTLFATNGGRGIALDPVGDIVTIGQFYNYIEFPPFPPIFLGPGFLVKHNPDGIALCISTSNLDFEDISIDPVGNVFTISGHASLFGHSDITVSKWGNSCNHLWDIIIYHDISVGIEDLQNDMAVAVFPNPTMDVVSIELPGQRNEFVTIALYDFLGKPLQKESFFYTNYPIEMDLNNVENGVYLLKIVTEKAEQFKRIVKI